MAADVHDPDMRLRAGARLMALRRKWLRAVSDAAVTDEVRNEVFNERDPAFGLWDGRTVDGLDHERKLRSEWGAHSSIPTLLSTI